MSLLKFTFLFLVLMPVISSSQDLEESELIIFETKTLSSNYYIYNPPYKAKGYYKDTLEATNLYPEQVMISMASATNQDWENYNYLIKKGDKKPQSHFDQVRKQNPEKNYFELKSKYEFIHNELPTVFLKFYFVFEGMKEQAGGFKIMQKVGSKWYITSIVNFVIPPYMLFWFKDERMLELLKGQPTGNAYIDELIPKTRSATGSLDFEKLGAELSIIFKEGSSSPRYTYLLDPVTFKYKK